MGGHEEGERPPILCSTGNLQLTTGNSPMSGRRRRKPLDIAQILTWADAYHARRGRWPTQRSGVIDDQPELPDLTGAPVLVPCLTWATVNRALCQGFDGLPGGTSLAQLLTEHRAVRRPRGPRQLTVP